MDATNDLPIWRIGDIDMLAIDVEQAVDLILERVSSSTPLSALPIRLVNSYSLALATRDETYRQILASEGLNLTDGRPVAWLGRAVGAPLRTARGPSLMHALIDAGRRRGTRHFFLGGSPDTLDALLHQVRVLYPGTIVSGAYSPPFRALDETEQAELYSMIEQSGPDLVWVGLGTPKQDFEAQRIAARIGVHAIAVGAAFDFIAGSKREAPAVLRDTGLEWLYRLSTEPRRLWRRYLFGNLTFLRMAFRRILDASRTRS